MRRRRNFVGNRVYSAAVYRHNGNLDEVGVPTYTTDADWVQLIDHWPCELLTVSGGEDLRGRQVSASTSHVLYGEYFGSVGLRPDDRIEIAGKRYNITAVMDEDGLNMETRVEVRQSWA